MNGRSPPSEQSRSLGVSARVPELEKTGLAVVWTAAADTVGGWKAEEERQLLESPPARLPSAGSLAEELPWPDNSAGELLSPGNSAEGPLSADSPVVKLVG